MSERLARTLVIASWAAAGANLLGTEMESRISESFYPPRPVRWIEILLFVVFVVCGWLALPFALKARRTDLAIVAVTSIVVSSVSIGIVLWLRGADFDPTKPINTRDRALDAAKWAYTGAVQQGYDVRTGHCIFSNGGSWIVVVDGKRKRSLTQAIRLCSSGLVKHAVVLDLDGKVRIAR